LAEFLEMAVIGALGPGGAAVNAVEDLGGGLVEEGVEAVDVEIGFEPPSSLHIPGGVDEVVERKEFEGAFGGHW
jgi:hypothetical protein